MSADAQAVAAYIAHEIADRPIARREFRDRLDAATGRRRSYGYYTDRIGGHLPWDINELHAIASILGYPGTVALVSAALDSPRPYVTPQ